MEARTQFRHTTSASRYHSPRNGQVKVKGHGSCQLAASSPTPNEIKPCHTSPPPDPLSIATRVSSTKQLPQTTPTAKRQLSQLINQITQPQQKQCPDPKPPSSSPPLPRAAWVTTSTPQAARPRSPRSSLRATRTRRRPRSGARSAIRRTSRAARRASSSARKSAPRLTAPSRPSTRTSPRLSTRPRRTLRAQRQRRSRRLTRLIAR